MGRDYYVSQNGSDSNGSGTKSDPYRTLKRVEGRLNNASNPEGSTIYLKGGTHKFSRQFRPNNGVGGTRSNPITLRSYPDERAVLDFSSASFGGRAGIELLGPEWHVKNIHVRNSPGRAFRLISPNATGCVFENVEATGNEIAGIDFYNGPKNNVVRNSKFHHNRDSAGGGKADGARASRGADGQTFEYCDFYYNSDDGIDLYHANPGFTLRFCRAWGNGYAGANNRTMLGDGNGFKLGGRGTGGGHTVHHCISFDNSRRGFDYNTGDTANTILNCTAARNPSANYRFDGPAHVMKNNISWDGRNLIGSSAKDSRNSWNLGIKDPRFVSLDPSNTDFLNLKSDSPAIDAGVDVGFEYLGSGPDLGAREHGKSQPGPTPEPEPTPEPTTGGKRDRFERLEIGNRILLSNDEGQQFNVQVDRYGNITSKGPL